MNSNEERREIAARLRNYENLCESFRESPICAFINALGFGGYLDWKGVCNRLADLIDPEHDRICHKELITEEHDVEYFGCSWYGEYLSCPNCYGLGDGPNYCENCGCKVDKSIVTDESS